ncbi:oligosaccharide flippase family protein [Virgibacillus pantothenticus]|uniref:oligosaccharide flippase family protein n=1 Tax=Virgibacillus pantothenticus TaxID=1473 RepID=UPI000956F184|nr:oligosaccharide flippase family protein [Virgibacillus pantothenticus]MED3736774.1 oligosaccharide flippase family protein [Virgibacillus pantothenticus]QTY15212.1 oligosaccharide flippase family protein [Virgibacillus pantothenticus]SIT05511.1 Membrane protein involved in the export of O-antigen and teichoic acid [Virgibacillus pantothenticus]
MKLFNKISNNNFTKSVLLVSGGTAFAQLLNTVLSPVISRIYLPEEYGVLTLYTSILGFLTIISSLKYEHGIAIADNDKKAINVLTLSLIILFIFVSLITLIFVLIKVINLDFNFKYSFLIPIGIFTTGLYRIFMQWSFRKKNFKSISKTKVSQSIFSNITKISLGILNFSSVGLILGNIIGGSAGIRTLSSQLRKSERNLFKSVNKKRIIWSAKRYVNFPIFLAPSQLLNAAGIHVPIFFLTFMYGNQMLGFYGLANTLVNIPTLLVGNSVGDVFYGEAANIGKKEPERLKKLSIVLFKKLLLIGIIPLIVVILFGPYFFSIVFGSNWHEAGIYARILSFMVFTRLIFMPISRVFEVYEKQKEALYLDMLRFTLVLLVFIFSILMSLNPYWTVSLYCLVMSLIYFLTFFLAQRIINKEIISND